MRLRKDPAGHRNHGIRDVPGSSFHYSWCECAWSERTISFGAASGALSAHLREAKPMARTEPPAFVPDDVEDDLQVAERALGALANGVGLDARNMPTVKAAHAHVARALDHYRARLTQPDDPTT